MKKRGFTLTEIVLSVTILVSIGLIIALGLNKAFDQRSGEEKLSFEDQILSSADLYLLNNQNLINDLQTERGFIIVTVGELMNAGFLAPNLTDPETNDNIEVSKIVRVSLDGDGLYLIEYEPEVITEPYLDARTLTLDYGIPFNCSSISSYQSEWRKPSLRPIDANGSLMNVSIHDVIKDINCDVDTNKPGNYTIEYIYQIPPMNVTKSYKRNVIVSQNPDDIVNLYASVEFVSSNPNKPENCNPEASSNNPPIGNAFIIRDEIRFTVKGEKLTGEIVDLNINAYEISGDYSTSSVGSKKATITYKGENSTGSVPTTELKFSVMYDPDDIVGNLQVTTNKSEYIIYDPITFTVKGTKRSGGTRTLDPCEYIRPANANTNFVGTITPTFTYNAFNSDGKKPKGDVSYTVKYDPEDIIDIRITGLKNSYCVNANASYKVEGKKRKTGAWGVLSPSLYTLSPSISTSSSGSKSAKVQLIKNNSDNSRPERTYSYQVNSCISGLSHCEQSCYCNAWGTGCGNYEAGSITGRLNYTDGSYDNVILSGSNGTAYYGSYSCSYTVCDEDDECGDCSYTVPYCDGMPCYERGNTCQCRDSSGYQVGGCELGWFQSNCCPSGQTCDRGCRMVSDYSTCRQHVN